nr:hypothetical protein [Tanacetum cinerariifolium]
PPANGWPCSLTNFTLLPMADQLQQVEKVLPEDIARTFEAAVNVFQGKTEHMDDLLKNGGTLLRKVSKNFSSTQMILGVAALAVVSIIVINRASQDE